MQGLRNCKLVIIGVGLRMEEDPFQSKLKRVLEDIKIDFELWCWDRHKKPAVPKQESYVSVLLRGGGEANCFLVFWYPIWMAKVLISTVFSSSNVIYFCINLDTALPVALSSSISRGQYIFANMDNLSRRYRWPSVLRSAIGFIEKLVAKRAIRHLLPGVCRWETEADNIRIIPNSPHSWIFSKAKEISMKRSYNRRKHLTVYVNGWLTSTRGLAMILKALSTPVNLVKVIVAGKINCKEAEELIALPNVEYYSQVSPEEAMALYYKSHLVCTFYDPSININLFAQPNKWYDCIVTNTPFVVNSEVITAHPYISAGACFTVHYDDWRGLSALFKELAGDMDKWRAVQRSLAKFEVEFWDVRMRGIVGELLRMQAT